MRIVFVADVNSPHTRNWVSYFIERGDQVEVICQYPVLGGLLPGARIHTTPLLFSRFYALSASRMALRHMMGQNSNSVMQLASHLMRGLNSRLGLQQLWYGYVGPLEAQRVAGKTQQIIDSIHPDIVHSLRIPMEGESLACLQGYPLVLSVWGNDFTLWAAHYRGHRDLTRLALRRADGLQADCERDIRLAQLMGYAMEKPALVSPSGGGIRLNKPVDESLVQEWRQRLGIKAKTQVVLNPRGIRAYVKTQEYFQAIPDVLRVLPDTVFISVGVQGDPVAAQLVQKPGLENSVRMLPWVSQSDLVALFRLATVIVSPSVYDGTPNTLLEGMASGSFPLAGDIESVREWIRHGENGLLFDPTKPQEIAAAIIRALSSPDLREQARVMNLILIRERAEYDICMRQVGEFYHKVVERSVPHFGR